LEKILKENNGMYQALLNLVYDPVIVIDNDGNVVEFNRSAEEFFNDRFDEILKQIWDVIEEAKEIRIVRNVEREVRIDGAIRSLLISAHSVNGKIILTMKDRTHDTFFEEIPRPTYVLVLDKDMRIIYANAEIARLMGYKRTSDLINKKIGKLFEDGKVINIIRKAVEDRKEIKDMEINLTVNGRKILVNLSVKPIYKNGKFMGTIVTFTDVEDITRLMRLIIEKVPYPIHIIDEKGRVIYASEEFAKFMGYSSLKQVIGKNIAELYTLEDVDETIVHLYKKAIKFRKYILRDGRILRIYNTGKEIIVRIVAVPIYDNEELLGVLMVIVDFTEIKKKEKEMQDLLNYVRHILT